MSKFGHPEPTQVRITPKKGKAILISGHDMQDTFDLLAQTEGKGEPTGTAFGEGMWCAVCSRCHGGKAWLLQPVSAHAT